MLFLELFILKFVKLVPCDFEGMAFGSSQRIELICLVTSVCGADGRDFVCCYFYKIVLIVLCASCVLAVNFVHDNDYEIAN